ncbi:MAG: hypothetical protein IH591_05030, partial [Bacteroidales bacterium]|nr:hypothetical protein [Bacteroidales bacterium]
MKQFDDKFSRKAKEAFENYNADHLAEAGWNSYTKKYGKRRSRALIIPLWAKVASVAAILTVVVLLTNRITHRSADEPGTQLAQGNRSGLTESAINEVDTTSVNPEITATKPVTPSASPVITNPSQASGTTVSKAGQIRQTGTENPGYQVSQPAGPILAETAKAEKSPIPKTGKTDGLLQAEANKANGSHLTEKVLADGSLLSDTSMAARSVLSETKLAAAMSDGMKPPDNPMKIRLTYAADTQLKLTSKEEPEDFPVLPREKMTTTIMGGLSGMMASIDNTTSISQGVSIGFYVEQQLTRRISVRPGLAMAKHNYAMENMSGGSTTMDYA